MSLPHRGVLTAIAIWTLAACGHSSTAPVATTATSASIPASTPTSTKTVPSTSAVTTTPASVTTAPPSTTPPSTTTVRPPLQQVVTFGDGVMFDLEPAVTAAFAAATTTPGAFFGSGLTRGELWYDWPTHWAQSAQQAQLAVVLTGVWDARPIVRSGQTLAPGTPAWTAVYDALVDQAVTALQAGGAKVVWVLPLSEADPAKSGRIAAVATELAATLAGRPGVSIVDGDAVLTGASHTFASRDSAGRVLRKNDGEHLCPLAAARLAGAIRDAAAGWFRVPSSPVSDTDPWHLDGRYGRPSEGCPTP